MANDLNIESLSIDFQVTSASAMDAVDKLEEKLNKLKAATQGGLQGASSVAKSLEKIALAAKGFDSVDTGKLTATAEALNKLGSIAVNGNLSGVAAQMKDLSKIGNAVANLPSVSSGQLQTLTGLGSALSSLANIPRLPDLSSTARSLTQLNGVAASITTVDMSAAAIKIQELTNALKPLETLGKTNLSSFINSLKKLPDISTALSAMDMTAFAAQIQSVAAAISPLTAEIERMATAVGALPQPIQNAVAGLINYNNAALGAGNSTNSLLNKIKNLLSIGGIIAITRRVKHLFGGMIESSNMFVENMNLFSVSMGNAADEALNFANRVNELMGIDVSQWIENQGYFKQIASGFGVVEDKANLMSKNLTQLGFDIASFYNISVESAMQKLQSGISGEIMPLRSLGYALDESTLKQVAYNHGITDSITNMAQAQKSQIRYLAIMEQSKNAMGDMARTLESPANQMRIFEQRVDQLKRAIGNGLMPIISAALPWVTAFVKLLTEGAQKIADFLGFEIPEFDYGDLVAQSNKGVSSSFDDATKAAKEFKGTLSSIDQLNIIGSEKDKSGTGIGDMYDLNIDLPSYDFLGGLEESTDKAYNSIKKFFNNIVSVVKEVLPWIEALAAGFVGIKLGGFLSELSKINLKLPTFSKALGAGAASGMLLFDGIKNLITGSGKFGKNIAEVASGLGIATTAILLFAKFGNPVGAVITGIAAAFGLVMGAIGGIDENITKMNKEMADSMLFNNGGTKISEVADAFGEWANTAEAVNRQTIEKYSELGKYDTEMDNLLETMKEIAGVDINPTALTPEEAANLRKPFSDLCSYLETDFKQRTQTAANDLKEIFTNLGLGEVVSSEIGQAYADMQDLFSRNLTKSQTKVDEYLQQVASGGMLTEAQQIEFATEYKKVLDYSRLNDQSYMDVQKSLMAFSDLDLSKIDFETDETAQKALQDVLDSTTAYQESALERYNAEMDNLLELEITAKAQYENGDLTKAQFEDQLALLDFSRAVFAENLNSELDDVTSNIEKVLSPIDKQLYDVSSLINPTVKQVIAADAVAKSEWRFFDTDYTAQVSKEIAQGEWLENNPTWQKTQELKDFVSKTQTLKIETELPIDNKYSDTYEILKAAKNGEKILLELEPTITTTEPIGEVYTPPATYDSYYTTPSEPTKAVENDPVAVAEAAQVWTASQDQGVPEFNLYTTVEMDGAEVSRLVTERQDYEMRLSGGR